MPPATEGLVLQPSTLEATPVLPVLSGLADLGLPRGVGGVLDVGDTVWLNSGSAAIQLALRNSAVGPGTEVLVPAFNCPTMVTPIRALGATPVFYRVTEQLDLAIEDIAAKLTSRCRGLIAPHLFGRIQNLGELRALCDAHRIVLVEDCAHMFFALADERPIGSWGHYAIASPKKFFPLAEGGLLVSREKRIDASLLPRPGIVRALRDGFDMIDLATRSGRLRMLAGLVSRAKRLSGGSTQPHASDSRHSVDSGDSVDSDDVRVASVATRIAVRLFSHERVARKRRENFAAIRTSLAANRHMKLLDIQDPRAVPYMVPVILDRPAQQFADLKRRGLPMWRWEHSIMGVCDVTDRYAQALIQLPCHQALTGSERASMLAILAEANA